MRFLSVIFGVLILAGCQEEKAVAQEVSPATTQQAEQPAAPTAIRRYRANIINTYPHDTTAFTQGLFFHDGYLYEGTGRRGQSSLRKAEIETGKVIRSRKLEDRFFGEGITLWQDKIVGLTWQSGTGLVHDLESFNQTDTFFYKGEGWGLTANDTHLIMSDGSAELRFLDPDTFEETSRLKVTANGQPVLYLNELEWIDGLIYANVWRTDAIIQIDPFTGHVVGIVDLSGLLTLEDIKPGIDVLNGIAWDKAKKRLFVTGKNWPKLFEVELLEINQ